MDNPGAFSLGDFAITGATMTIGVPVTTLQGLSAVSLQARLAYGAGGTSVKVYGQTSLDQGQTWCDVVCFAFGAAGGVLVVNLGGDTLLAPTTPSDGTLADNTALPGPLGDQWRVKIVVTGTYTLATLLSVWGVAR